MPTLVFSFFLFLRPEVINIPDSNKMLLLFFVVLTTFVLPMISIFIFWLTKSIKSFHLRDIEDRIFPFSVVSIFYVMATYFFYIHWSFEPILVYILGVITICIVLLTSISFFWKISAHMTGISGLIAIITVTSTQFPTLDMLYPLLCSIMACGVIGTARLYLNAHTPMEVFGGFFLGFSVCFFFFYFLLV